MAVTNAKFTGRAMILRIGNQLDPAGAVFATLGGVRTKGYTLNNEEIDTTDGDDDVWKKGIEGGIRSLSISVSGLVSEEVSYELMRAKAQAGLIWSYSLEGIATADSCKGKFMVTSLEENGEYNGAQQFSATLASQDTITFTNT